MELVHEMTLRASLDPTSLITGPGPYGTRMIASVTGGTLEGTRVSGTIQGAGADWLLIGADGFGRLDVRAQIVTGDGAVLYLTYGGVVEMNETAMTAVGGPAETSFDDQYFRTTPVFETGDERYAWLNTTVFVGRGRVTTDGVEYEIFRVT